MTRKRFVIGIAIVALLSTAVIAEAFVSRSSADSSVPVPDWLLASTQQAVAVYSVRGGDAESASGAETPQTASWSLTTADAYRACLPERSAETAPDGSKPLYVVTIQGRFTATHTRPGSPAPSGSQLLLVYDAETHALGIVGVLNTPIDESALGAVQDMVL